MVDLKRVGRMLSPLFFHSILRLERARGLPGTACLLYHEADRDLFKEHIQYLKKHYRIISISELVTALNEGSVPEDSVVITIDDGYRSVYSEMYPVAVEEEVPISVFVATEFIDSKDLFWWDKADIARERGADLPSNRALKEMGENERRQAISEQFREEWTNNRRRTLRLEELTEMSDSEYLSIYPHSRTHPRLSDQSIEEARTEITQSRTDLMDALDVTADIFSFPDGSYTEEHIDILRETKYRGALTITPGINTDSTDPYRIRRISMCGRRGEGENTETFNASRLPTMGVSLHGIMRRLIGKEFRVD
jgi:peptidoglycan/xylan/chitin deacetylase (PgdA/CDA1 family)